MRVLVVEDDPELADLIATGLRNAAYAVDVARTYAEAVDSLSFNEYDVACIDLGLPDGNGLNLIRALGPNSGFERPRRLIVLTARDAVTDRIAGLDAGADDYLTKPFDFDELLARLRAVSRRQDQLTDTRRVGDITINLSTREVVRTEREVSLTAREFALLRYFMEYPGHVLSAERLLEHVWDSNADQFTTSVRVILHRLRKKLGEPNPIDTVGGAGYRLRNNP